MAGWSLAAGVRRKAWRAAVPSTGTANGRLAGPAGLDNLVRITRGCMSGTLRARMTGPAACSQSPELRLQGFLPCVQGSELRLQGFLLCARGFFPCTRSPEPGAPGNFPCVQGFLPCGWNAAWHGARLCALCARPWAPVARLRALRARLGALQLELFALPSQAPEACAQGSKACVQGKEPCGRSSYPRAQASGPCARGSQALRATLWTLWLATGNLHAAIRVPVERQPLPAWRLGRKDAGLRLPPRRRVGIGRSSAGHAERTRGGGQAW